MTAGIGMAVIGAVFYLHGKYYAWLGRDPEGGKYTLRRGWRTAGRVEIVLGKSCLVLGGIIFLIGIVSSIVEGE
jgi:hypothetical protein